MNASSISANSQIDLMASSLKVVDVLTERSSRPSVSAVVGAVEKYFSKERFQFESVCFRLEKADWNSSLLIV